MKYLVAMLAILLLTTNVFWIYNALDKGVTTDHSRSAQTHADQTVATLLLLSNLLSLGQSYETVSANLEHLSDSILIKRKSDAIFVNSVVLIFNAGSLSAVKLLADLSSDEYDELEE